MSNTSHSFEYPSMCTHGRKFFRIKVEPTSRMLPQLCECCLNVLVKLPGKKEFVFSYSISIRSNFTGGDNLMFCLDSTNLVIHAGG